MLKKISTETTYNASSACSRCGKTISPIENIFTNQKKSQCLDCKNKIFIRDIRSGLS